MPVLVLNPTQIQHRFYEVEEVSAHRFPKNKNGNYYFELQQLKHIFGL